MCTNSPLCAGLCADNKWIVPLLCTLKDAASLFFSNLSNSDPQFSISPQSTLDELGPRKGGGVSGSGIYMLSSLHGGGLTCMWGCCDEHSQKSLDVFRSQFTDVHYRIVSVYNAVYSQDLGNLKIAAIQHSFPAFSPCVQRFQILWMFKCYVLMEEAKKKWIKVNIRQ